MRGHEGGGEGGAWRREREAGNEKTEGVQVRVCERTRGENFILV